MGLFLQTAVIPGCRKYEAQDAVENIAVYMDMELELEPVRCSYRETERGSIVLFNEGCRGYEALAEELSARLPFPVLLCYIYDEDFWGYYLYERGVERDCFSPIPDYFEDCSARELERCAGNSALLAQYFSVEEKNIRCYLRRWTPDMETGKAYPDDEFGQGDCWQMADFMKRLGFPYTFGEEEPEQTVKALPSLEEILSGGPSDPGQEEGVWTLAKLPSVLDEAYIRGILTEETGELLRLLGSENPFRVWEELEKSKYLSPSRTDPVICILRAYCCWWSGQRSAAYYELYAAMPPALPFMRQSTNGLEEPDVILLLRARSLVVPVSVKRHIALQDLARLRELDPENEDVYLLAAAHLHFVDTHYHGTTDKAYADLMELSRVGLARLTDGRVLWAGFPEDFKRFVKKVTGIGGSGGGEA